MNKLIVIEGLDGSGKAVQSEKLEQYLSQQRPVKRISLPDYDSNSSALVKMYLNKEFGDNPNTINAYAVSSFYAVDRYANYKRVWENDYKTKTIIADRYTTSNAIYQLAKLDKTEYDDFLKWLEHYEYDLLQLPRPDIVLYLDMPIHISQKLMSKRYNGNELKKDIHETNIKFLEQCRATALYAAEKLGWKIIKCNIGNNPKSIDDIHKEIIKYIT